ncbi:hypothetical protein K505DRAFT_328549 [Melanomma pulvis-pyrius CBS 109.77]|uniref:RNA polymerase II assembly factor Rtp1 C-terminal domain-containing protein n=1 Tax=Melanomma pulvis-pyrius CBS 109.77 TaxID=1314802 RepID=A0A6A6WYI5_9PLEO|nr:hypothetical protein K505DRAFT_328549 [Melanomma pulvis-pyrius CBS 109.77]
MGAVEDAVDAAADFIGPFLDNGPKKNGGSTLAEREALANDQLVEQALFHLHAINSAETAADPNAPYDGSLVGIVYGLLDLITSQGILLFLSPRVAFAQRPRSVLISSLYLPASRNEMLLSKIINSLIPIYEQNGTGVQPLLTQRVLPDLLSAVAELSFSPYTSQEMRSTFEPLYVSILAATPVSRLLPVLTSWLQQEIPQWLRQRLSRELALIPLRIHGIRHTVEFLSLSYLSKNSQAPQESSLSLSQIPIPLEAITQASRLLASAPSGMSVEEWVSQLAPQLWGLLDGTHGKELARAAGQIIAGGFLCRKATGAPGMIGWELFARPLLQEINPEKAAYPTLRHSTLDQVVVGEQDLKLALKRLSVIISSYSHAGLIKRLVGPVLLPLWGLMSYVKSRPSLEKEWAELPRALLSRYISTSCDPKQIDTITTNIFGDGQSWWTFGPGSHGGVEIRRRVQKTSSTMDMSSLFSRIEIMNERINDLVTLLMEANINDEVAGAIFLRTTKRWLSLELPKESSKTSLTNEEDTDPVAALVDAKLSEAMATRFQEKFARSPQHIIELMSQLLQDFVTSHMSKAQELENSSKPSRAGLRNLVKLQSSGHHTPSSSTDTESEDLVSFAISILTTLIASPDFKRTADATKLFPSILSSLSYLFQSHPQLPLQPFITNAATNLFYLLDPKTQNAAPEDPLTQYRTTLKSALADLTSPDPPNRAWALSTIRKLIQTSAAFPLIDIPSTTHMVLSASIADPDSYVHSAAIPLLVELALRAPNPTFRILVDAFVDIDERSLHLKKEQEFEQALDFRLRVGEILNNLVLEDGFWSAGDRLIGFNTVKTLVEATLSLASRRGQRQKTLSQRSQLANIARLEQEEGEEAWGGPIPNLRDPEGEDPASQAERDALLKIVKGWEDTGIEEDVRIRTSALSILGLVLEKRLESFSQVTVDAGLQMVLQIVVIERSEEKTILRRAAVLVIMGLLRGMDASLEDGREGAVGLGLKQSAEAERVLKWVGSEDADDLVRSHAETVLEGLETWNMKRLFKYKDDGFSLNADLGLEGNLRGLNVRPSQDGENARRRVPIVEELE